MPGKAWDKRVASGGRHSHGCTSSQKYFDGEEEPQTPGKAPDSRGASGESRSHGCASSRKYLMGGRVPDAGEGVG